MLRLLLCLLVFVLSSVSACADEPAAGTGSEADVLAVQATQVLSSRCLRCHGGPAVEAGLDVSSRDSLIQERGAAGNTYFFVNPGQPDASRLVEAIGGGADSYMPQSGSPEAQAMTQKEKELLVRWVVAGAPFPQTRAVTFVSETQVLEAIRSYQLSLRLADRDQIRFYSLTHLQNNAGVSERDLRLYRAALIKTLNSLSSQPELYTPELVPGTQDTVYAVDLRKLGWDQRPVWGSIQSKYPYGLRPGNEQTDEGERLADLFREVALFSGAELPVLRADWFIVNATQPPLYHEIMDLPATLTVLEEQLELNLQQNFLDGRLQRSGFARSGVSRQNRLLERHTSPRTKYFWISYDFLPRRARGDLPRFPLGPQFDGHPFPVQAFAHDGGEAIWSLPNGLQAYILLDAKGARIDAGPIEVVFDRSAILGAPSIINGISCIACHRAGMITEFRDEIRTANAVAGEAAKKVRQLYPQQDDMQALVQQDQKLFVEAQQQLLGPILCVGPDAGKQVLDFPEPVGKVAEMYSRDLTPGDVSLELGYANVEQMQQEIRANRELLLLGMGTLIQSPSGTLKREKWETVDGTSLMQEVAVALRLGVPLSP
ncbi:MAG: c-type cytochrome domain-containing protein [Planctomycetia bacterium]